MINGKIIKVCGMREAQNIRDVESLQKVDMMGFIFYPKSPRYLYELPAYLPIHARRIGVFVNEDKKVITMYADRFGLEYIQLHGKESPEYCQSLRASGLKIINAFSVARPKDLNHVSEYEKACNLFLFDTKCEQYGGSGNQFDWNILHTYIDSTNQIATINWWRIDNVQVFVHHLLTVCQSVPPFQDGVESKFDTISRSFGCVSIHISQCTGSQ